MLRTILLGLDGSPDGDGALELGIDWARRHNAMLVGLAVIDAPAIRESPAWPVGPAESQRALDEGLIADANRRADQVLERFAIRCAEEKIACKPLEDTGVPCERILDEAVRFDLVVLGRRGHYQYAPRNGRDETLEKVIKGSARPVVTVTERPAAGDAVLIAYDGSPPAARAVQAFVNLGLAEKREVVVVSVGDDHASLARGSDRIVDFLDHHGIVARSLPVESPESPALVILRYTELCKAGLVVMGSFGKPAWKDLLLGSTTREVVRESNVPVFLHH
ncbi:MAG: universal stress protein [Isosphaeraceae bacterium]